MAKSWKEWEFETETALGPNLAPSLHQKEHQNPMPVQVRKKTASFSLLSGRSTQFLPHDLENTEYFHSGVEDEAEEGRRGVFGFAEKHPLGPRTVMLFTSLILKLW
jgi:hypothetical protein